MRRIFDDVPTMDDIVVAVTESEDLAIFEETQRMQFMVGYVCALFDNGIVDEETARGLHGAIAVLANRYAMLELVEMLRDDWDGER